jgi:hypothetical protein
MTQAVIQGSDWEKRVNDNFDDLYAKTLTTAPASDAQALAKSATDKAVTPGNLAALGSTATFAGLVELATNAEALLGTDTVRCVTPANLLYVAGMRDIITFAGRNLAGVCTLVGVKAGDVVLSVTGLVAATVGDQSAKFETTITVNDQIQQSSATDLSTYIYMAYIQRKS